MSIKEVHAQSPVPDTIVVLSTDSEQKRVQHLKFWERLNIGKKTGLKQPITKAQHGFRERTRRSEQARNTGERIHNQVKKQLSDLYDKQTYLHNFIYSRPNFESKAWGRLQEVQMERMELAEKLESLLEGISVFFNIKTPLDHFSSARKGGVKLELEPSVFGIEAFYQFENKVEESIVKNALGFRVDNLEVANLTPNAYRHIFDTVLPEDKPGVAFKTSLTDSDGIIIVEFWPQEELGKLRFHPVLLKLPQTSFNSQRPRSTSPKEPSFAQLLNILAGE